MGFDFNQYLKHYVYVFSTMNYVDHKDRLFLDKIEEVLENHFGEKFLELIVLRNDPDEPTSDVYVVYDNKKHPFEDDFIMKIVKSTLNAMGVFI